MSRHTPHLVALLCIALLSASRASAQTWVNLTPVSGSPPARAHASAIHDPVDNRMIIFGGRSGATNYNDVWAFDLDTNLWAQIVPTGTPPAGRRTPASIYDPVEHRMITWSGQGAGNAFFNDVWSLDLDTNAWAQFTPAGGPPNVRYGVGYTYDPQTRDLVTFAGFTNLGRFDDVWRFNDAAVTWTDVTPGLVPLERCLHAACYDNQGQRMIMYGGQNSSALDDIWAFDLATNTWSEFTPDSKPAGRYFAVMVHDDGNRRATVFGGQTATLRVNETWVFDLWTETWTMLTPSGTPPTARFGSAGIYDGANDRMIVFGGDDTATKNDVWALEDLSSTATGITPPAPAALALHPNRPNPFNPSTTIAFEVPSRGRVQLRVYDVRGALVRTLLDETRDAGAFALPWDGRDDAGRAVSSGVYFYRLDASGNSRTRKMVVVK